MPAGDRFPVLCFLDLFAVLGGGDICYSNLGNTFGYTPMIRNMMIA